jgi:hypothetical protein
MNLCSEKHDEVCFESRYCPACEVADDKDEEIEKLQAQLSDKDDEISELTTQIEGFESEED